MTTETDLKDVVFLTRKLAEVSAQRDAAMVAYRNADSMMPMVVAGAAMTLAGAYAQRARILRKVHDLQNKLGCHVIYANAGTQAARDEQSADHYDKICERERRK